MKKIFLSILITLFAFKTINAQLSLTKAFNEPLIGDTNKAYLVDTGSVNTKTINAISGNNVVWDYSALTIVSNSISSTPYTSTTSVASASDFPGADYVQNGSNFYKSVVTPTTQIDLMGTSLIGAKLNFTNTAVVFKFPFTFSNNYTDPFSGTVTFTSNGSFSGNITVNADGTGTLNIPGGQVFTNVLRVKTTQSTTVNGIITTPFPLPIVVKITNYDYYHASQKFPVFSVSYNSIAVLGPTVTGTVRANTKSTVVGLKENILQSTDLTLYPNPTNAILNISVSELLKPKQIIIYNQLGSVVYDKEFSSQIDISYLLTGIYLAEIKTEKGIIRKKIIKQ